MILPKNYDFTTMNACTMLCIFLFLSGCTMPQKEREVVLYKTYCASCHIAPEINSLPKNIWAEKILPEMGARLGIRDSGYNPYEGLSFAEMEAVIKTGIFPGKPIIDKKDWEILKNYIVTNAPDSLAGTRSEGKTDELTNFTSNRITLDNTKGTLFTLLTFQPEQNKLMLGDLRGNLSEYDLLSQKSTRIGRFGSPVVSVDHDAENMLVTVIGNIRPTELSSGRIFTVSPDTIKVIPEALHRPVHVVAHDFDKDGINELIVSEFGDIKGQLSLFKKSKMKGIYTKKLLLNQPGTIRVIIKDMDKDGKNDLVALTAQGDEGITILYNEGDLKFKQEKVIRFSPVYGTSDFQLIDYDHDGDDDIITVHGDNADKSFVSKPYHGMRIHINNGKNNFTETYFYPLNGATGVEASDFDQDGDIDIALVASFPDYENKPDMSFVYLENKNELKFTFSAKTFKDSKVGRWFLMDTGDVDSDGDEDIILSSFTYAFTPVPRSFSDLWTAENVDIMILENKLN